MLVRIADLISNKVLKIEVDEDITIKELIDAIIAEMKLPSDYLYTLVHRGREIGPDMYPRTLRDLGIEDGDELQLLGRPQGGWLA